MRRRWRVCAVACASRGVLPRYRQLGCADAIVVVRVVVVARRGSVSRHAGAVTREAALPCVCASRPIYFPRWRVGWRGTVACCMPPCRCCRSVSGIRVFCLLCVSVVSGRGSKMSIGTRHGVWETQCSPKRTGCPRRNPRDQNATHREQRAPPPPSPHCCSRSLEASASSANYAQWCAGRCSAVLQTTASTTGAAILPCRMK